MKVFADIHHSGLYYSLKLLFEDRLGWELYAPIGMEWANDGWWNIHAPYGYAQDTARQYLDLDNRYIPTDGTPPLTQSADTGPIKDTNKGFFTIQDVAHNYVRKHLNVEQFKNTDIDFIIASVPQNAISFKKLRDTYKPKAKLIFQMGNMFNEIPRLIKDAYIENLMASVKPFKVECPVVFYHQHVDRSIFCYRPITSNNTISSFVIGLPREELFLQLQKDLPDYKLTAYASSFHPFVHTINEIADIMASSTFGYHVKPMGDGFGHILYNWAFIGRPVITFFSDYKDKLGEELLIENNTAINLDNVAIRDLPDRILQYSSPANLSSLSMNMKNRVQAVVRYDDEQVKIEKFLSGCR